MDTPILIELFGRIQPLAAEVVDGLDKDALIARPEPAANSIAWLVWHSARVQDSHIAELLEAGQLWTEGSWAGRVGLDADPSNTGYGHSADDVGRVAPERPEDLLEYFSVVQERTMAFLDGLSAGDLDRVVDPRWDPPVTMAVRLVSIAEDDLLHLGQAAYVRGLLGR